MLSMLCVELMLAMIHLSFYHPNCVILSFKLFVMNVARYVAEIPVNIKNFICSIHLTYAILKMFGASNQF